MFKWMNLSNNSKKKKKKKKRQKNSKLQQNSLLIAKHFRIFLTKIKVKSRTLAVTISVQH